MSGIMIDNKFIHSFFNHIKNKEKSGLPLRLRLFSFLMMLVLTMFIGIIVILSMTGAFSANSKHNIKLISNELAYVSRNIEKDFGNISGEAVILSENLSKSIENSLLLNNANINRLKNDPALMEKIIYAECDRLLFALQKTKSSGVFMILDGTVNPSLKNSYHSKAGFYLKNMEPNVLNCSTPTIIVLRGFPGIARQKSLSLHAQWTMEFNVENADYYHKPINKAIHSKLPLSRHYYWSSATILPGTNEEVIICSVPLIASDGTVFGICGFEISAMLFKLSYQPVSSTLNKMFIMLSPIQNHCLVPSKSLFAGEYKASFTDFSSSQMFIFEKENSLTTYKLDNNTTFYGLHKPIKLYPDDSVFSEYNPVISVMVPKKDIDAITNRIMLNLLLLCILLILAGIGLSFYISNKYVKPVLDGLNILKSDDLANAPKIKVPEIDDLIEFLSLNKNKMKETIKPLPSSTYEEFVKRAKTLSPAERAVFDLYVEGYTAKEIAGILCLSINTIKTHNKRIYMKLNVASRKELLAYVNMIKQEGKEINNLLTE